MWNDEQRINFILIQNLRTKKRIIDEKNNEQIIQLVYRPFWEWNIQALGVNIREYKFWKLG